MAKAIYLESMDSTRSAWTNGDGDAATGAQSQMSAARLQVFIESLISLAFGRSVVVQQSFALDSYAFQRTLLDIDKAFREARDANRRYWEAHPPPVQLHLFKVPKFKDSIVNNLKRAGARSNNSTETGGGPPFTLSLYPELNRLDTAKVEEIAASVATGRLDPFFEVIGDQRSEMFSNLWKLYAYADVNSNAVLKPSPRPYLSPDKMLEPILAEDNSAFIAALTKLDEGLFDQHAVRSTIESLRTLNAAAAFDQPFTDRSRLFGGWSWAWTGAPAASVVGIDNIGLVREAVSTLYNRVSYNSIGSSADGLFTTPLSEAGRTVDLFQAQQVALVAESMARGEFYSQLKLVEFDGDDLLPSVLVSGPVGTPAQVLIDLFNEHAVDAFKRILVARTKDHWRKSLAEIAGFVSAGNRESARAAALEHVRLIAEELTSLFVVDEPAAGVMRLSKSLLTATATGGAGQYAETLTVNGSTSLEVSAAAVAGLVTAAALEVPAIRRLQQRAQVRAGLISSFGDYVEQ